MAEQIKTWNHLLAALRTEPRSTNAVQGASGIEHGVLGIGVDDNTRRVVLVSAEHDARTSALIQADVQATIPDAKVLMLRPVAINLNAIAIRIAQSLGHVEFDITEIGHDSDTAKDFLTGKIAPIVRPFLESIQQVQPHVSAQLLGAIQQMRHFDLESISRGVISIKDLLSIDFTEMDRQLGICYMPLYDFSGDDWELMASGVDRDAISERLSDAGILQYFFPPMDNTALGFVHRGITDPSTLKKQLPLAPHLGHPFEGAEIVGPEVGIENVIDALQDRGLIVEGEAGLEASAEGDKLRWNIKFQPREGLLSKLINRSKLEVNLSSKEWFGITKK